MAVKLRKRKLASGGFNLYLDIYHNGRRQYEFLNLYLTKDTVSKLLGHKTIQATQIYAKIVDEKKKAAIELLPMIEWGK